MSKGRSIPNVEIGYSSSKGSDSFKLGVDVASKAVENIAEHSLSLMLVHLKGSKNIPETLDGITTVTEDAPVKPAESPYGNTKQIGEEIIQDKSLTHQR